MDNRRHTMSDLYLNSGILIWEGHSSAGKEAIQKYLSDLPPSEHVLIALDAQAVTGGAAGSQPTILITSSGIVKFNPKSTKVTQISFHQHFLLTCQGDSWRIVSDTVRHQR
ncbi:NTF2-related export protein-like [Ctenocephalides felis]|uniref:NTF2-related export protein-like n=1 Tax=Ctenocephalides felis TaxID=7515 RepID=UPI000E6E241C|nr:NTF2-related export protein-like [Ctenocephalides felis]